MGGCPFPTRRSFPQTAVILAQPESLYWHFAPAPEPASPQHKPKHNQRNQADCIPNRLVHPLRVANVDPRQTSWHRNRDQTVRTIFELAVWDRRTVACDAPRRIAPQVENQVFGAWRGEVKVCRHWTRRGFS